jgi:hypothetical protein
MSGKRFIGEGPSCQVGRGVRGGLFMAARATTWRRRTALGTSLEKQREVLIRTSRKYYNEIA